MAQALDRRRFDDGRYANDRRSRRRDRRQRRDVLLRSLRWFSVIGWGLVIASIYLVSEAKPRATTFFARINNLAAERGWDMQLMYYVYWMLFGALVLGLLGIVINLMRKRRKSDELYFSLVLLSIVSISGFFWVITL